MTDNTQTNNQWETVIGLEVHVQLATKSKIFSGASTSYGAEPNTQACIVDLAFPGVLPVLNHSALNMAIKFGLSIGAQINKKSVFARKNYFYPDLPKGYQISQHELPIVGEGKLNIILEDGKQLSIGVTRAHLEEDAGKSIHEGLQGVSGVDLNRAGTPLLEVVSEPDMRSAKEAVAYLKTLHSLVRYLGICDGNMQEGSFRCDANVSVRKKGAELGTRTEVKNVNSFRYVEKAILHEVDRQIDILEDGGKITQETRLYDPSKDETRSMRAKEEAHDYRYFPDPDLLPVEITDADIEKIRQTLPELPWEKRQRFEEDFKLNQYDASLLTSNLALAKFFEEACAANDKTPAKLIANWINGEMAAALNREHLSIEKSPVTPKQLNDLALRINDQTISNSIGKQVFAALWQGEGEVDSIIDKKGLKQMNNSDELLSIIEKILDDNPTQIASYHGGKDKLFGFFVGQAMKATKGRANPAQINQLIKQQLEKRKG